MSAVVSAPATTLWNIDASHSHVEFAVKHLMIATVKGRFADVHGTVTTSGAGFAGAAIDVTINAASIDTRQEQRDAHLRSADFFDVEQHPAITFKSRRVEADGDAYRVIGDLSIHGVTKEVALAVVAEGEGRDPWGNDRAGFSATTKINRHDFGLTWNQALEAGGIAVGTDIKISIDIELVKAAQ